jgi:diguanylate cyclase (GGDEF)-like protein/PAS domain S-box-containing protein
MPPPHASTTIAVAGLSPANDGLTTLQLDKDRHLLRRLAVTALLIWSLAASLSLYVNLRLMGGQSYAMTSELQLSSIVTHGLMWLLGLIGIVVAHGLVQTHLNNRRSDLAELELSSKVFDDGLEAIVITDVNGRILRVNPMFSEMTGFTADEVLGRNVDVLASNTTSEESLDDVWRSLRRKGSWIGENWKRHKNGESFAAWESASAIDDENGRHLSYIFMFQDITDRKQFSERLEQLAHYDPLTHLPNRRLLADRVDHAIERTGRVNQDQHALLFLDLDHFKRINDTVGHTAGDRLLTIIAGRLQECVRGSDTVARLGGDEFAILLEDIANPLDAERVAEKILDAMAVPVKLENREWHIGASIGISLTPRDGEDMATLLKNADTAMYRAKEDGRRCFRFFDETMAERAAMQVARETALRTAVHTQAFELHYQPQIDLNTGSVVGVEALIRWRSSDGMISPLDFIPLAEETGLIVQIGRWALAKACLDIAGLHAAGRPIKLAVNISAVELKQPDFVEHTIMTLAQSGLPPASLELEITESTMMVDVHRIAMALDALAAMGISLSIDDFGTGYSSLAYLKQLPVDYLKIDRSFVHDVPRDKEDSTIVRAILTMSRTLDLKVVA